MHKFACTIDYTLCTITYIQLKIKLVKEQIISNFFNLFIFKNYILFIVKVLIVIENNSSECLWVNAVFVLL